MTLTAEEATRLMIEDYQRATPAEQRRRWAFARHGDAHFEPAPRTIEELLPYAAEARKRFEQRSIPLNFLEELYTAYNPVPDIKTFIAQAMKHFPRGSCGVAGTYLQRIIGRGTITQGTFNDEPHTVLRLDDLIIDITADQYNGPRIYVGPITPPWTIPTPKHQ